MVTHKASLKNFIVGTSLSRKIIQASLFIALFIDLKCLTEGTIVGKADDDFYACANLWDTVMEKYNDRMYFGWWHPDGPKDNDPPGDPNFPKLEVNHPDAQIVLISWNLMKEILEKPFWNVL